MITLHILTVREIAARDLSALREAFPARLSAADRIPSDRERLLHAGSALLLSEVLGIADESALRYGQDGKPSAPGHPPFSLSHAGELCVLAVNRGGDPAPVGVDVEPVRPRRLAALLRILVPAERDWVAGAPSEDEAMRRFLRLWTLKESVSKAAGTGFKEDLRHLDVLPLIKGGSVSLRDRDWCAVSRETDGHILSVCTTEKDRAALPRDWEI